MRRYPPQQLSSICISNLNLDIREMWELEDIGVENTEASTNKLDSDRIAQAERTNTRDKDGRYTVELPWINGFPPLESNLAAAKTRLFHNTKWLLKLNKYDDYRQLLVEWQNEGVIEVVDDMSEGNGIHYIPHHGVIKESSETTKLRPVFDASTTDRNGNSLNSSLDKGANLLIQIPELWIKFRLGKFGVISDIRRAFLQIGLVERDREKTFDSYGGKIKTDRS